MVHFWFFFLVIDIHETRTLSHVHSLLCPLSSLFISFSPPCSFLRSCLFIYWLLSSRCHSPSWHVTMFYNLFWCIHSVRVSVGKISTLNILTQNYVTLCWPQNGGFDLPNIMIASSRHLGSSSLFPWFDFFLYYFLFPYYFHSFWNFLVITVFFVVIIFLHSHFSLSLYNFSLFSLLMTTSKLCLPACFFFILLTADH